MRREDHSRQCVRVGEATWLDEYLDAIPEEDWFAGTGAACRSGPAG